MDQLTRDFMLKIYALSVNYSSITKTSLLTVALLFSTFWLKDLRDKQSLVISPKSMDQNVKIICPVYSFCLIAKERVMVNF